MTKQDRQQELQKQREVDQISDFVNDHYAQFGAYPMEVQTETSFYTFDQYWSILDEEEHQILVQDAEYCYYLIRGLLELGSDELSEGKK